MAIYLWIREASIRARRRSLLFAVGSPDFGSMLGITHSHNMSASSIATEERVSLNKRFELGAERISRLTGYLRLEKNPICLNFDRIEVWFRNMTIKDDFTNITSCAS